MLDLKKFQSAFNTLNNHKVTQIIMEQKHKQEKYELEQTMKELYEQLSEHCPHQETEVKGLHDYHANYDDRYIECKMCKKKLKD